jgi:hypothetical protein
MRVRRLRHVGVAPHPGQFLVRVLLFDLGLNDVETMALDLMLGLSRDPVLAELERRRQAILSCRYLGPENESAAPPADWTGFSAT